jgi:hypothetical protein
MTDEEKNQFIKLNKEFFLSDNDKAKEGIRDLFLKIKQDERISSKELKGFINSYNYKGNLNKLKDIPTNLLSNEKVDWIRFKKKTIKEDWFLKGELIRIIDLSERLWINFEKRLLDKILNLRKEDFTSLKKNKIPERFKIKSLLVDLPIDKKIVFEKPFKVRLGKKIRWYIDEINSFIDSYQGRDKRVFWGKEFTKGFKESAKKRFKN